MFSFGSREITYKEIYMFLSHKSIAEMKTFDDALVVMCLCVCVQGDFVQLTVGIMNKGLQRD